MSGSTNNLILYSTESDPYGISYAEWTAKWWQWALSIPVENNPVNDPTGKNGGVNQRGPVWFLAGTLGGVVDRHCSVPVGKAILFPILNHGGTLADSQNIKSEEELLSFAKTEMDIINLNNLEATVDNVRLKFRELKKYRVTSPIFEVVLPERNLFGGIPGPTRGASEGYWLFLGPLPKGEHRIHSFGSCLSGRIIIGVNYDIAIT